MLGSTNKSINSSQTWIAEKTSKGKTLEIFLTDHTDIVNNFEPYFNTILPYRDDWKNNRPRCENNVLPIHTYGSNTDTGVGSGVNEITVRESGKICSVFQAERRRRATLFLPRCQSRYQLHIS